MSVIFLYCDFSLKKHQFVLEVIKLHRMECWMSSLLFLIFI